MISILYSVGFLLILHGLYQILKYTIVMRQIVRNFDHAQLSRTENKNRIFVLAPVLHEEKTILSFLSDITAQSYSKDFFTVYVITTEKEYSDGRPHNTVDIVKNVIPKIRDLGVDIEWMHYPSVKGFKTDQLNFAFQSISNKYGVAMIEKSYFLTLDADSHVDSECLQRLNVCIEEGVDIYQQPVLWFKNIDALKSGLMKSFAFMQSFFVIAYEIPMFINKFFAWRLRYLVGHGLCVKGSFIRNIGGYPSVIEDVRIGRLSSFLGTKVKLVPNFGMVETAKSYNVYLKQSSVWFFGCGLFISDFKDFLKLNPRGITLKNIIILSYGFFKALRWLNKGAIHVIGIGIAVWLDNDAALIIFIVSLFINSVLPALLVVFNFKEKWTKGYVSKKRTMQTLLQVIFFSPVLYMFNFFGLYYGLFKLVNFYICNKV